MLSAQPQSRVAGVQAGLGAAIKCAIGTMDHAVLVGCPSANLAGATDRVDSFSACLGSNWIRVGVSVHSSVVAKIL